MIAMDLNEIKRKISEEIDKESEHIKEIGRYVLENPELGFFEEKTSALVRKEFERLGIKYSYPLAVTGVKGKLGEKSGRTVCVIGEMDALKCAGHEYANENNVAHACGHNAQVASMLGAAIGIKNSGVMDYLDGNIVFFAVPAEEFNELQSRAKLKSEGKLTYFAGKPELVYLGAFDDIDISLMIHAQPDEKEAKMFTGGYNLGFMAKEITFRGKAAHGSKPHEGTNALNAAALAILGIHSNRDTFRDEERIRIHPIITKGGDVVNSVPDEVVIETYVRGATLDAIKKGDAAVERAVYGAAQMIGATAEIKNMTGFLPLNEDINLTEIFENNVKSLAGETSITRGYEVTGSTDMGDISSIMPAIQPSGGGFTGNLHGKNFTVANEDAAYILSAKALALTSAELLYDGAKKAEEVIKNYKPVLTKEEYLDYLKGE